METFNKVFTEEQALVVADKIFNNSIEKVKDALAHNFSYEMGNFFHEHYENFRASVEQDLIKEITEQFISDPDQYKYSKLREKLFNENKETLVKTLTNEAIYRNMQAVMENNISGSYTFNWMWKDSIVKIILENWEMLKTDDRIVSAFGRHRDGLLYRIKQLEEKVSDLQEQLNKGEEL